MRKKGVELPVVRDVETGTPLSKRPRLGDETVYDFVDGTLVAYRDKPDDEVTGTGCSDGADSSDDRCYPPNRPSNPTIL